MKVCPNCRLSYDDQANHCAQCGGPLTFIPNTQTFQDPADHTAEFDPADISQNKVLAMAPYLLGWIGIIITLLASGTSPYAAFHVKQALKIQICATLLSLIAGVLAFTIIVPIVAAVAILVLGVVQIICFFQVCAGKAKEPPIVAKLAFLK